MISRDAEIDGRAISEKLEKRNFDREDREDVLRAIPRFARGVILYGSRARGDADDWSDIDILVIGDNHSAPVSRGRVNSTTYTADNLRSAAGTLFGMHLARDGIVLHDQDGAVTQALNLLGQVDAVRALARVRRLAIALKSSDEERVNRREGFVRLARYLLRTAIYAQSIVEGQMCFSVRELAERYDAPRLATILSSHPNVHGPATMDTLEELEAWLERFIGKTDPNPFPDINSLIVASWEDEPELANSTLLVLGQPGMELPYSDLPRIIL